MKPLNRPMFKYGGPIKEGIMSGMKDSPQQLVKSNADGSRPGYAGPALLALPDKVLTAASISAAVKSGSLILAISSN